MPKRAKGGPFFALINHHITASEFAFQAGDYPNVISHMQSLANLLKVKLPHIPYIDYGGYVIAGGADSKVQRAWILQNRPVIDLAVRKWMDAHTKGTIGLWKEPEGGFDDGEEDDE